MTMSQTSLWIDLGFLGNAIELLPYIGIQAATIPSHDPEPCKKKLKTIPTNSECITLIAYLPIIILLQNVTTVLSDVLAFIAVIHQLWGLWKEKRRLHLHTGKDFTTLLLQQATQVIISYLVGSEVTAFQNVLSTILICEFTLDLRRRNTTTRSLPNLSNLEFGDLNLSSHDNAEVRSIRSVLGRLQKSIIADMRERNDPVSMDNNAPDQREPDLGAA
ncbi:hypothetical protein Clacol_004550 [Clathrus columnatus]|uniref:Uncharacterized protein n=1 Tax=Clathrus columnatus TaxID=1419009 RepID=A0AAV5AAS2_9AGAM|nr:hypothetical protein Clacol_004550 [Clathrus columnatus]